MLRSPFAVARAGRAPTLEEALRLEPADPAGADELYARLERANRLSTWWLVLLALAAVGAEAVYVHLRAPVGEDRVAFAVVGGLAGMWVPVYACLWREHAILNRYVHPIRLAGSALGASLMYLFLENLTIAAYTAGAILLVGLPLTLAVNAPLNALAGTPWLPSPFEQPWVYAPCVAVGAVVAAWLIMGGRTDAVARFLGEPLPHLAALAHAVRGNPAELALFAAAAAGSLLLAGSGVALPYEAFAAGLGAALVVFRDGLTSRDLDTGYLVRLGRVRTSLRLGRRGRALWLLDRLQTELDREDVIARELDGDRRNRVAALQNPLYALAVWPGSAAAREEDPNLAELSRHSAEWSISARNTELLVRGASPRP